MERVPLMVMPDQEMCDRSRTDQRGCGRVIAGAEQGKKGLDCQKWPRKNWIKGDRKNKKILSVCIFYQLKTKRCDK